MSTLPWARYWTPKWAVGTLHGSLHHHCMNVWIGQLLWIALSSPGSYKLNKLLVSVSQANSKHVYYVIINSYCLINVNKPSVRVYKKLIISNLAIWVISTGVFDGFNNYKCSQTTVCCRPEALNNTVSMSSSFFTWQLVSVLFFFILTTFIFINFPGNCFLPQFGSDSFCFPPLLLNEEESRVRH